MRQARYDLGEVAGRFGSERAVQRFRLCSHHPLCRGCADLHLLAEKAYTRYCFYTVASAVFISMKDLKIYSFLSLKKLLTSYVIEGFVVCCKGFQNYRENSILGN